MIQAPKAIGCKIQTIKISLIMKISSLIKKKHKFSVLKMATMYSSPFWRKEQTRESLQMVITPPSSSSLSTYEVPTTWSSLKSLSKMTPQFSSLYEIYEVIRNQNNLKLLSFCKLWTNRLLRSNSREKMERC